MEPQTDPAETIELYRSGIAVSSYLGSFGNALRETRLTSSLGFLLSTNIEAFRKPFGIRGRLLSVVLEKRHGHDRCDIELNTDTSTYVIEAKRGVTDPIHQAKKYKAAHRILITNYIPAKQFQDKVRLKYLHWAQVGRILDGIGKSRKGASKFISRDLLAYMEEHGMIQKSPPEIYARDINNEETLTLFLKANLYGCDYEKHTKILESLYFAPHFGKLIGRSHPGIGSGISYVSKIQRVLLVESWKDLITQLREERGKVWLNKNKNYINFVKEWQWTKHRRYFLVLGDPRLVFNPPVKKNYVQKGAGHLSKNYLTFDHLFHAWTK